ncbi:MAG: RNB domain-containing ribonuclease [Verrucomicrobiota bacterium]|nr:RNB domain-containing ribonuclease [Verrucomicrobiota bacterium]
MKVSDTILQLLKERNYVPMRQEEILNLLDIKGDIAKQARRWIAQSIEAGKLQYSKDERLSLAAKNDLISGRILFRQSGSAFVIPDNESNKKGAIGHAVNAEDTGVALHGDHVLVQINERPKYKFRSRGGHLKRPTYDPVGKENVKVNRILKRAHTNIVGTLKKGLNSYYVDADEPRIVKEFTVKDPRKSQIKPHPKIGDKVVVHLLEWQQRHLDAKAEIIEVLGKTHEPDAEFKAILYKYELEQKFPPAVVKQTKKIPDRVHDRDIVGREDCRDIFTFTIDPDDAKDFDDALSIEELEDGKVRVGIHIADVSAYVKPGSALDKEAQKRGNSTYLVGTVIPMLPHALSNGLCSLVEAQDRLTKSVFLTFSENSQISQVEYANTVICSNKRLTYGQAYAFMQEEDLDLIRQTPLPPKHQTGSTGRSLGAVSDAEMYQLQKHIRKLWEIARRLREARFKKGSLDLEMTEIKIYVDKDGFADRIEKSENDESHQLIEEFMLSANEQVARMMQRQRFACIYRVHDHPDEEKLQELRETMASFGVKCGDLTQAAQMSRLLKILKDHPQGYTLKTHLLRSLKQAQYRASADGHYGLAKKDYTHFTSPIRRYSDLVVHRVFDAYLCKHGIHSAPKLPDIKYSISNLESIGVQNCIRERNSIDAERESVKTKLLEYYERELNKENKQSFHAVITDIKNHGMYIEITDTMAYGMVHVSTLDDDFYHLSQDGQTLTGRRNNKIYSVGQYINVQVERVDRFKRQIDFCVDTGNQVSAARRERFKRSESSLSPKELTALRKQRRIDRARKKNHKSKQDKESKKKKLKKR